jgi:PAS domain S-box-containing protein
MEMLPGSESQDVNDEISVELTAWRARVLNTVLVVALVVASPVIFLVFWDTFQNTQQWAVAAVYAFLYLLIVALAIARRLPSRVRAWGFLLAVYLAGALAFARGGLAGDGRIYFLALPVLAFILLGVNAAVMMGGLTLVGFVVLAVAFTQGWIPALKVSGVLDFWSWSLAGVVWAAVTGLLLALQRIFSQFQEEALISKARLYEETDRLRAFNENIVQSMEEGVLLEDSTGRIVFANPRAIELMGYTADEIIGRKWSDLVAPDQFDQVQEETDKRSQGISSRYETLLMTQDGQRIPVIVSARPLFKDGRFDGVLAVFTDISDRVETEEKLRARAAQQTALNAIMSAATTSQDMASLLNAVLDHTLEALELEIGAAWVDDQYAARGVAEGTLAEIARNVEQADIGTFEAVVAGGEGPIRDDRTSIYIPTSSDLDVGAFIAVPILDQGRRIGMLSVASQESRHWLDEEVALLEIVGQRLGEFAERLRLLAEVQEQIWRVQRIIDTVPVGVVLLDVDRSVLLANPMAKEYLDVLAGVELGGVVTQLGDCPIEELLTTSPAGVGCEAMVGGASRRIFNITARPTQPEPQVAGWVLVMRDITRQREIQQRVQEQDRLAVVGQLAAGIAHDFNNILAAIVLYADLLMMASDLDSADRGRLETIIQQAERGADLTRQIVDFSRSGVITPSPLELVPFLRELVKMLRRTLAENIAIELVVGAGSYQVEADPARIQQVFMNLAVNARDAMPEGGELRIELDRIDLAPGDPVPIPEIEPGKWIEVRVIDTGEGIPPEVRPHIFEPFFTTKELGRGTGLGLAQVYGIVVQHGGHIRVESEVGQGTEFVFYLPARTSELEALEAVEALDKTPVRGAGEVILVVEDDPAAREAIVDILRSLNYQVLDAADGREALRILERSGNEVDLVLSDLVVPGLGGMGVFRAVKRRNPAAKIVAMTGYPLRDVDTEGLNLDITDWIRKPVNMEQLAQVVHHALHGV